MPDFSNKSDAELQDILQSSRAVLKERKTKTRKAQQEQRQAEQDLKNHAKWEAEITDFTDTLLKAIAEALSKEAKPKKLTVELPDAQREDYFYSTPGYAQVINAICIKYNVSIEFSYDDGFSSNWGSDWPSAKAEITFGQRPRLPAEQTTIKNLLKKVNKA